MFIRFLAVTVAGEVIRRTMTGAMKKKLREDKNVAVKSKAKRCIKARKEIRKEGTVR
jgi:hypothetical protein